MMLRYLAMDTVPELRSEIGNPDRNIMEIEVMLPLETYWNVRELIEEIKYSKSTGDSAARAWKQFASMVLPCIVHERDRAWFLKNVSR